MSDSLANVTGNVYVTNMVADWMDGLDVNSRDSALRMAAFFRCLEALADGKPLPPGDHVRPHGATLALGRPHEELYNGEHDQAVFALSGGERPLHFVVTNHGPVKSKEPGSLHVRFIISLEETTYTP